jgi:hypothetical protein
MTLRMALMTLPLVLGACAGDTDDDGKTTDTEDTEPEPEPTADTARPDPDLTGNVGSIVIGHWPPDAIYTDPGYYGYGMFTDQDGGVQNLAACLLIGGPCVDAYPTGGATVTPDPDLSFINYAEFFDAGAQLTVGPTTLRRDLSAGVPLYAGAPSTFPHGSPGGLEYDGDLAPASEDDVFTFVAEMEVLTPDPGQVIAVGPGGTIDLTWTPGGVGEVYLEVGLSLTHLEDDGQHTLDVDTLGLVAPFDSQLMIVTRLTQSDVDANGNLVKIQTRSDQWMYVEYQDTDGWTELTTGVEAGETCADAQALAPLAAGQYFGDTSGAADDHDLGDGNPVTGYGNAGREVVVPIALTAGQTLDVTYTLTGWDGSLYLLNAGCDTGAPLDGADSTLDGDPETISYTATADEVVHLVLDAWTPGEGGRYSLVVDIN